MKKTKIICTMGPACENEAVLKKMILDGPKMHNCSAEDKD